MKWNKLLAALLAVLMLCTGSGMLQMAQAANVPAASSSATQSYQVTVTADQLNVRQSASNKAKIVGLLKKGNVVTITAEKKDSRGVTWGKYSKGWINLDWTKKNSSSTSTGTVNVPTLNVRQSANNTSKVVKTLSKGTKVTITDTKKDSRGIVWGKVKGAGGWINTDYIKSQKSVSYKIKITGDKANIRQYASISAKLVNTVKKGSVLSVTAEQKDSRGKTWVKLANGKGWISMENAAKTSSSSSYKVKITAASLTIRKSADIKSKAAGYLSKNDVVTITNKVNTSDGRTWGKLSDGRGWISLKYTKKV